MTSTSDTFVPIVSSSPPPIDFGSSEDEDDEFGTFSAAKVEESDSSPEKAPKLDSRHFIPIDSPSGTQTNDLNSFDKAEENSINDETNLKSLDTDLSSDTGSVKGKQKNEAERTTTVFEMWDPPADIPSQPNPPTLSNGISHQESSHSSSDSLEFIQSGDRESEDTKVGDTHAGEGNFDMGIKTTSNELRDQDIANGTSVSLSSSISKTDTENREESNSGDFGSFHKPKEIESPETARTEIESSSIESPSNFEDNVSKVPSSRTGESGSVSEEDSVGIGSMSDGSGNDNIIKSKSELPIVGDTSIPSGINDNDHEFGDFGSFAKNVETTSKEVTTQEGDKGLSQGSGSASKVTEDDEFDEDFVSFQSTSVKNSSEEKSDLVLGSDNKFGTVDAKAMQQGVKLKSDPSKVLDKVGDEDDDDFAEFSAFKTDDHAPVLSGVSTSAATSKEPSFAAFDAFSGQESSTGSDWASFGTANSQKEKESNDHFGDFGNFEAPRSNLKFDDEDDEDDFASFESSRSSSSVNKGASLRVNQVLDGCFPNSAVSLISSLSISLQPLSSLINSSEAHPVSGSLKLANKSTNGLGVWAVLSDMENTKAMGYQWTKSDSKKKLLSSLGLDERNILASRLGGVPKFAPDLGMLQPSKPGEVPPQPETPLGQEEQSLPVEESVPKVEFDWSGSGLINPLDVPSIDPDILDLEAPPIPSPALAPSKSTFKPLDEIMKSSSISMVQQPSKRESDLSGEANRVLDGLPDLSFMLTKVLMFPIRSPSSPLGEGTKMGGGLLD
ncbi:uncharacterized protein [Apostichopus japonicus]|uniref:uncharacterized protein isoform X3 n=1 Tax=Stichopus japonicus TaxID=307972 RepID=UPI003AB4B19E